MNSTIRKHYRKFILIGLAIGLSLSANVALAAHQLVEDESGILELQPTKKAGDATGQVEFEIVKKNGGSQNTVGLNGKLRLMTSKTRRTSRFLWSMKKRIGK